MQIWTENQTSKNTHKNGFGGVLGSIWGRFKRSRTSCGRSWATLGRFGSVRNRTIFIYWSTMVSERPLGSILDRFRRGFGSMWERIWMLLATLGADSKLLLDVLFVATFRTGTPSLLRYAPRSVTIFMQISVKKPSRNLIKTKVEAQHRNLGISGSQKGL